ncbi:hypothetical protein IL306_000631 [Fusarium sp. DS 682]|nr:hypothetical protein IL306_000631 [Fusarium sp. DS 682]
MPALRPSVQPYNHAACTTGHLGPDIEEALITAVREERFEIRKMAHAIARQLSRRDPEFLIKLAIFDCSLIRLVSRTDPSRVNGISDGETAGDYTRKRQLS